MTIREATLETEAQIPQLSSNIRLSARFPPHVPPPVNTRPAIRQDLHYMNPIDMQCEMEKLMESYIKTVRDLRFKVVSLFDIIYPRVVRNPMMPLPVTRQILTGYPSTSRRLIEHHIAESVALLSRFRDQYLLDRFNDSKRTRENPSENNSN